MEKQKGECKNQQQRKVSFKDTFEIKLLQEQYNLTMFMIQQLLEKELNANN